MRLIDADELRDEVLHDNTWECEIVNYYLDVIDYTPAVDAAITRHGTWKTYYNRPFAGNVHRCTICGFTTTSDDVSQFRKWYKFCPNCGAEMNGGE